MSKIEEHYAGNIEGREYTASLRKALSAEPPFRDKWCVWAFEKRLAPSGSHILDSYNVYLDTLAEARAYCKAFVAGENNDIASRYNSREVSS